MSIGNRAAHELGATQEQDFCEEYPCDQTVICNINMGGRWDISHPS